MHTSDGPAYDHLGLEPDRMVGKVFNSDNKLCDVRACIPDSTLRPSCYYLIFASLWFAVLTPAPYIVSNANRRHYLHLTQSTPPLIHHFQLISLLGQTDAFPKTIWAPPNAPIFSTKCSAPFSTKGFVKLVKRTRNTQGTSP